MATSRPHAAATPFGHLSPDRVLDALAGAGVDGDGRVLTLNSYENRVFLVHLGAGEAVVAKFYRPGRWTDAQILEEHAFAQELLQADVPVAAPRRLALRHEAPARAGSPRWRAVGPDPVASTLIEFADGAIVDRFSVTDRRPGRSPELDDPDVLTWIGRFLGRLHAVGRRHPFAHRHTLDPQGFGEASVQALIDGRFVSDEVRDAWESAARAALGGVRECFERAGGFETIRLHGDCHVGNILWTEHGPHFVDLDDAMNGPALQDLWMLLSGDRASMTWQLAAVLEGYETFSSLPPRQLHLLEALRTLRILHYSAWIARRWSDPAFPAAFSWFGTPAYWSEQTTRLREQAEAMAEPPLPVFGPA